MAWEQSQSRFIRTINSKYIYGRIVCLCCARYQANSVSNLHYLNFRHTF